MDKFWAEVDCDAFRRAVAMMQADPDDAQRVTEDLKKRSWEEVAQSAAYHAQMKSLKLRPWQCPPCWANEEINPAEGECFGNLREEVELLQRMLAAGLSNWEPDPLAALERVEAEASKPA
jgi:hypothetical protein